MSVSYVCLAIDWERTEIVLLTASKERAHAWLKANPSSKNLSTAVVVVENEREYRDEEQEEHIHPESLIP